MTAATSCSGADAPAVTPTVPWRSVGSSSGPFTRYTAGASAPNEVVEDVIATLAPAEGVELVRVTDEDEYFPPPRNLRELQGAIEIAATAMLGGTVSGGTRMDDRALSASDVLSALAAS